MSLLCAQDPHSSLGDLAPSGPQEGRIALTPPLQATPRMRVRGRSAEGVFRVLDSRAAVRCQPQCARVPRPRCGLCASPRPSAWGRGVEPRGRGWGRGGPRPLLASDTPAAPAGLPYRLGKPRATPGWQFGVSPHLPDQTGARDGRGRGRAWESGWDKGVPLHGDPLRGDCRVPWEAEEPWGSGPFGQQVGPGAVR